MMSNIRAYIDANVVIFALDLDEGDERSQKAFDVLEDSGRVILVSDYLWLEVRPKTIYHKQNHQTAFIDKIFDRAEMINSGQSVIEKAKSLAVRYGLSAMDALHAASAIEGRADELITFERPTKPFYRIPASELRIVSLYN
ncbi:MAG: PIN domain-containing protein [Candidatus Adiutrix sp.]|jgi:predicted nucleic acid-binding protein|nr:PIN domain-containing protein [Candidatus Adiutrix sp.]